MLDLFSGIGAFSLGLERAGMRTVAFCEIDPFARRVLAKHWPEVPQYDDIRSLTAERLADDGIGVDVICGGFPCQDISVAGRGAGLAGERSGLWSEFARLIGEIRPRYAIVENVAALLGRGLGTVLGDLAALGYDAEWHCIPASAVGAPHIRDRVWIVAYAKCAERRSQRGACDGLDIGANGLSQRQEGPGRSANRSADEPLANAASARRGEGRCEPGWPIRDRAWRAESERLGGALANANGGRWREQGDVGETQGRGAQAGQPLRCGQIMGFSSSARLAIGPGTLGEWAHAETTGAGWWATEPDVGRVVDGPASRVDRRKRLIGLGNALVPQIPELIGRAIMAAQP